MARIGFIGLGGIDAPMACNLLAAGHEVTGFALDVGSDRGDRDFSGIVEMLRGAA